LRERGMNFSAQPLSKYEASIMRRDAAIRKRVIVSYKMMLDLYGMCLLAGKSAGGSPHFLNFINFGILSKTDHNPSF